MIEVVVTIIIEEDSLVIEVYVVNMENVSNRKACVGNRARFNVKNEGVLTKTY